jgi:hypothetical protein
MSYGQVAMAEDYPVASSPQKIKKVKKPGFFKRWLLNSLKESVQQERENEIYSNKIQSSRGIAVERTGLDSQPMHLKIYRANGGTIVETSTYDRHKDRSQNQLHIIGHDTDLGEGLSKIITMESLRG